ncbi:phage antirepressor protein [Nitratiruptor sp. YY08-14]|uniref:phage antirepressor N-terminal domain-containing protein n=1 Tax=Nitratiruptor sp. YY08-14 TaxID=2724899 RepID=UPI0019163EAC|nr:phage antirepressor N-terminal domain-containing protein [Nitratiruptor sp. YY08-14]BCD63515.1 phage antirepressor protein [Nitratiruptor sp. YY08-14]BCD83133.1 phage antirepressor protein [Nitratiruptor phage NrS-3]
MKLEVVKFKNDDVEVINDSGQLYVSIKKVCENLGIDSSRQYRKIQNEECFEAKLIRIQTPTGQKAAWCIPLEKLNGWLFTINPNKVKPEVKQKLIAYKNECFKVLYNHFLNKATQQVPANCPAERFDARINGYKSQLAQRKKQIEELQWRVLSLEEELKRYKQGGKYILLEHNVLDLAGSYARLREQLIGTAESLEYIAKNVRDRIETVDQFIKAIEKTLPKSKNVVKSATKHIKTQMQWQDVFVKNNIK